MIQLAHLFIYRLIKMTHFMICLKMKSKVINPVTSSGTKSFFIILMILKKLLSMKRIVMVSLIQIIFSIIQITGKTENLMVQIVPRYDENYFHST